MRRSILKCPSCNTDDIKGLYCSNCGTKLPQEKQTEEDEKIFKRGEEEIKNGEYKNIRDLKI